MSFSQCFKWSAKVAASLSIALFRALLVGIKVFSFKCQPCFTCNRGHEGVSDTRVQEATSLQRHSAHRLVLTPSNTRKQSVYYNRASCIMHF